MKPLYLQYLSESFKVNINSPEELSKWMNNFEYGWMDKNYKKYYTFDDWFDNVVIHLPQDTYKYKIGTCYERTLFEHHVFSNQFPQYELKMIHLQQYFISNHAFLLYKKNDRWFYFEHSYAKHRGIHGPFKNIEEVVSLVKKFMLVDSRQEGKTENKGFGVTIMDPDKFKVKMSGPEFYKRVGYNWSKMERP